MQKSESHIKFKSDNVIKWILYSAISVEIFILLADILVNRNKWSETGAIRRLTNITREDGIANWFSSIQLLFTGIVCWIFVLTIKNYKDDIANAQKKGWIILASFFTYMGFDDATKFHERMGTAFRKIDPGILDSFPSYAWQIVFGPLFFAMGCFMLWFFWTHFRKDKSLKLLIIATGMYVLAVAMDFVEGIETEPSPYKGIAEFFHTKVKNVRHYSKAIEETIEMLGTTFFMASFLRKLFGMTKSWKIEVKD